jgi:hypothetical protein
MGCCSRVGTGFNFLIGVKTSTSKTHPLPAKTHLKHLLRISPSHKCSSPVAATRQAVWFWGSGS